MKTAVIQLNATDDKQRNIKKALSFVGQALQKRAEFILLPEVFSFRGRVGAKEGFRDIAEGIPGESLSPLMALARRHKVFILAGSIYERVKGSSRVYNTSVLIDADGSIRARYRKIHLFDAVVGKKSVRESDRFLPGRQLKTASVEKFKIGMSICYDVRFPQMYRAYTRAGADILCIPSAFTRETGMAHWEILLRARAIENLCYVAAPNQAGKNGQGIHHYGNSMIVDPWGTVLARASAGKEEIIFARIRKEEITRRRKLLPSLHLPRHSLTLGRDSDPRKE
jgi:predicted amidohydrolase